MTEPDITYSRAVFYVTPERDYVHTMAAIVAWKLAHGVEAFVSYGRVPQEHLYVDYTTPMAGPAGAEGPGRVLVAGPVAAAVETGEA